MIALIDRALSLNPSFARGWNISGSLRLYAGDLDRAIEHAGTALRLSPRERVGTPLVVIGLAHFFKRQFDEAMPRLQRPCRRTRARLRRTAFWRPATRIWGRLAARETLGRLRAITPP